MIHSDLRPSVREIIADCWIYVVIGVVYLIALVTGLVVVCQE